MKREYYISNIFIFLVSAFSLCFYGCKKDKNLEDGNNTPPPSGTRTELTLDSVFLYAKQIYLWNDKLPDYNTFDPRQYASVPGSELNEVSTELFNITQIPINPATGKPYEYTATSSPKYSYVTNADGSNGSLANVRSDVSLEGAGDDFGFTLANVNNTFLFVRSVEVNSPAYNAGLKRGFSISKINGQTVNLRTQAGINFINDAMMRVQISLNGQRSDGTVFAISIAKTPYTSNPVFKKSILTVGARTVGYLAYARFSKLASNSQPALDQAFQDFSTAGVTDLIVDLRYNGGGYVETAEYLINLIAPSSLNGKVMFIEHYNDLMRSGKASLLANQFFKVNGVTHKYSEVDFSEAGNTSKFAKKGGLQNIQNVYFIVTSLTASASELVINSLKPYLNVKLIGSTTYGKPVGFFPITIDRYTIYMSNFQSRNSANQGDYFSGFSPDVSADDDVTRDFGDPAEVSLSKALALIGGVNASAVSPNALMSVGGKNLSESNVNVQYLGTKNRFNGMIENRYRLK